MCANGCIDAASNEWVFEYFAVHAFAHAVQALQLKSATATLSHLHNGRNSGCIMGGKLRKNSVGCGQQGAGACKVCYVGMVLVGKYRVVRQAHFLGAFNFGIPIRAFDEPAHQAQLVFAC